MENQDALDEDPFFADDEVLRTLKTYYILHAIVLVLWPAFWIGIPFLSIATNAQHGTHQSNWIGTHYRWLFRTMWLPIGALALIAFPGGLVLGLFMAIVFPVALAGMIVWVAYRCTTGWKALNRGEAMFPIPVVEAPVETEPAPEVSVDPAKPLSRLERPRG